MSTAPTTKPEPCLFISDRQGIYIPKNFATMFFDRAKNVANVSDDDWLVLEAGPDHEHYWEAWDTVSNNAIVTDSNGDKFFIHLDGDCWLVPVGMEWNDERDFWVWPDLDPA